MLINALLAAVFVSIVSLVGVITLFLKKELLHKIVVFLVALSAGTLMGGALLHLMPESLTLFDNSQTPFLILIIGFSIFFFLERLIRWRHCHEDLCEIHPVGPMNLIGDMVHNFFDGLVIIAAFMVDVRLGMITTLAVIFHEIPQELGDFGVLIHAGYSFKKALLLNFFSALTAILGVIVGYMLSGHIDSFEKFLLPLAAGGFLHIAASDLVPELHKEKSTRKAIISFIVFGLGVLIIYAVGLME